MFDKPNDWNIIVSMNKHAQALGRIKTPKKSLQAKENGKLGGRPREYIAKLTIYDLPTLPDSEIRRLYEWLDTRILSIQDESPKQYSKVAHFKLMK